MTLFLVTLANQTRVLPVASFPHMPHPLHQQILTALSLTSIQNLTTTSTGTALMPHTDDSSSYLRGLPAPWHPPPRQSSSSVQGQPATPLGLTLRLTLAPDLIVLTGQARSPKSRYLFPLPGMLSPQVSG